MESLALVHYALADGYRERNFHIWLFGECGVQALWTMLLAIRHLQ